jgi:transmembrane 9 superfamily protein 3
MVTLWWDNVTADEFNQRYADDEDVIVYANKIGPFNNPLETYAYFEMPMCPPYSWEHKFPSLGEALVGDELYRMNVSVAFKKATPRQVLCTLDLTETQAQKLITMVNEQYWYQLYVDNLPMWASLGKVSPPPERAARIYLHQRISIGFNDYRIVVANLTAENDVPIPPKGGPLEFTYSVEWSSSRVSFENRFRRYLDDTFFEHRIHWFSIFNSFMMVLFLSGLVVTILSRTLRADYAEFTKDRNADGEDDRDEWKEDTGWKQVCLDVFRVPPNVTILCALVGVGWQLIALSFAIILVAIASVVYTSSGGLLTYGVLSYAVTSYVAGYSSGLMFLDFTLVGPAIGSRWFVCMMLTGTAFPGFIITWGFLLNFVAIAYDSAQAIPFGTMIVVLLLWACVSFPLVVLGTMVGRHRREGDRPVVPRVSQIPRIVPRRPWYLTREFFILVGGILPFGSIFIELYFVFTSFWNYKFYYVYGFMLLVFIILLIVTASVAIVSTYFLLNAEDHRWPWTSFWLSASTALYVFLYAIYFYIYKTKMSGFFMTVFYFSYMILFCLALGILCGTVGYVATMKFVRRIYRFGKME